jgi:hypothetical protein
MDIKRKKCDIQTWKKHLILDIYFSNIDTFVPSPSQCIETHSIEIFVWLLSQPLSHLHLNLFMLSEMFATQL